jgi:colanic acid biosynthesis glycosyl transferase WcaI
MRILLYSANFAPEPTGIGKYSGEMAAWLASQGHSVRVIAAPPYYPNWKIDPSFASRPRYLREQWKGVDVWRAPLWIPKNPGGLARVLHLMSFAITSFPIVLRQISWRPDLVVSVAPALVCAPAALLTARLSGAQAWLHLQDFEIDVAFQMGLLKGKLLKRLFMRMERGLLRRFDGVSSISHRMVELLLEKGVTPARTRYFPNWVDMAKFRPMGGQGDYRGRFNIPADSVVILFSGTLGRKQGLMQIPAVAKILIGRRDILFVICGDGVLKPELEAATTGMTNVRLIPLQPSERLGELLALADIHLLPQNPDAADLVLPSKLSGMLASGRPVIATCRSGTEIDSVVSACGLVVAPDDSPCLANAVCTLADDQHRRLELGRRARTIAEDCFERDAVLSRFFAPIDSADSSVANDAIA